MMCSRCELLDLGLGVRLNNVHRHAKAWATTTSTANNQSEVENCIHRLYVYRV